MAFTKKQEKEGTMISDWLNEHGNPEIEKKVEREAILKYGEPKQETLEEAMRRNGYHDEVNDTLWREGVLFGAKWQQEIMYSEEEAYTIWKAGQEYWKTSGASITFEELTEQFKKK